MIRRRGRIDSMGSPTESGPERAEAYQLLTGQVDALVLDLDREPSAGRTLGQVRDDHARLARMLGDAVSQAFAADAVSAPTPARITSWSAEGLARSEERELALIAATDISGLAQVNAAPSLRWGGSER
jgi:hypothetical protein